MAGLPALHSSEPGQVRKEAATAISASAGGQARHPFRIGWSDVADGGVAGSVLRLYAEQIHVLSSPQ